MLNQEIKKSQLYNRQKGGKQIIFSDDQETTLSEIAVLQASRKSDTLLLTSFLLLLLDALQKLFRAGLLQPGDLVGVLVIIRIPLQLLENLFESRPTRHDTPLVLARPRRYSSLQMPDQSYARCISQKNACHEYPEIRTIAA